MDMNAARQSSDHKYKLEEQGMKPHDDPNYSGFGDNFGATVLMAVEEDNFISESYNTSDSEIMDWTRRNIFGQDSNAFYSRNGQLKTLMSDGKLTPADVAGARRGQRGPINWDTLSGIATKKGFTVENDKQLMDNVRETLKKKREFANDITDRASASGFAGQLAGGFASTALDPPMIIAGAYSLPVRGVAAATNTAAVLNLIGRQAGKGFAMGAAIETPLQLQVYSWKQDIESPYGIEDALFNIAVSGGFDATLEGVNGALHVLRGRAQEAQLFSDTADYFRNRQGNQGPPPGPPPGPTSPGPAPGSTDPIQPLDGSLPSPAPVSLPSPPPVGTPTLSSEPHTYTPGNAGELTDVVAYDVYHTIYWEDVEAFNEIAPGVLDIDVTELEDMSLPKIEAIWNEIPGSHQSTVSKFDALDRKERGTDLPRNNPDTYGYEPGKVPDLATLDSYQQLTYAERYRNDILHQERVEGTRYDVDAIDQWDMEMLQNAWLGLQKAYQSSAGRFGAHDRRLRSEARGRAEAPTATVIYRPGNMGPVEDLNVVQQESYREVYTGNILRQEREIPTAPGNFDRIEEWSLGTLEDHWNKLEPRYQSSLEVFKGVGSVTQQVHDAAAQRAQQAQAPAPVEPYSIHGLTPEQIEMLRDADQDLADLQEAVIQAIATQEHKAIIASDADRDLFNEDGSAVPGSIITDGDTLSARGRRQGPQDNTHEPEAGGEFILVGIHGRTIYDLREPTSRDLFGAKLRGDADELVGRGGTTGSSEGSIHLIPKYKYEQEIEARGIRNPNLRLIVRTTHLAHVNLRTRLSHRTSEGDFRAYGDSTTTPAPMIYSGWRGTEGRYGRQDLSRAVQRMLYEVTERGGMGNASDSHLLGPGHGAYHGRYRDPDWGVWRNPGIQESHPSNAGVQMGNGLPNYILTDIPSSYLTNPDYAPGGSGTYRRTWVDAADESNQTLSSFFREDMLEAQEAATTARESAMRAQEQVESRMADWNSAKQRIESVSLEQRLETLTADAEIEQLLRDMRALEAETGIPVDVPVDMGVDPNTGRPVTRNMNLSDYIEQTEADRTTLQNLTDCRNINGV